MISNFVIKPHVGLEGLILGTDRATVIEILGEPYERSVRTFERDKSSDELWEYLQIGLNLTFSSVDNWLLGAITVESAEAELEGLRLVGLSEEEFLTTSQRTGVDLELEDDFTELGSKDYVCDRLGLSFWISDGEVSSITIFPKYDKTGNIPLWPVGHGN